MLNRSIWLRAGLLTLVCLLAASPVLAHGGDAASDSFRLGGSEVLLLTAVSLTGIVYIRRIRQLWQRVGKDRVVPAWRVWLFVAALVTLAIALASPLEHLSGELFAAHMVQHVLLLLVAAPLLVLGLPPGAMAALMPYAWRRPLAQKLHKLTQATSSGNAWPLLVWLLYALAFWVWHVPALYEAAVRHEWIHFLEHGSFVGTAVLFWWTLAYGAGKRQTSVGLLFIFTTALHSGLLGVLLSFSRSMWYGVYADTALPWGITPLADQQLGGAIMWVVAGFIYLLAALVLLHAWFRLAERREKWAV